MSTILKVIHDTNNDSILDKESTHDNSDKESTHDNSYQLIPQVKGQEEAIQTRRI